MSYAADYVDLTRRAAI
jgi:hypothetical protein